MDNKSPVRYPVGHDMRHSSSCIGHYWIDSVHQVDPSSIPPHDVGPISTSLLNYVQARHHIYLRLYYKLVIDKPQFIELCAMYMSGQNILINEVDGPHQEDLEYYMRTYGVTEDFIQQDTILATKENLTIMAKDTKNAFGSPYLG